MKSKSATHHDIDSRLVVGRIELPTRTVALDHASLDEVERRIAEADGARLPTDAAARKGIPLFSGLIKYFPDALAAVAELSRVGNDQHNPGKPLHWDRSKSGDELDALTRHLFEAGTIDTDGTRHSTKAAWRALANLQKELEAAREAGA